MGSQRVVSDEGINYFVCTLGQARSFSHAKSETFKTINEFLDRQNDRVPDLPAVGFPVPQTSGTWTSQVITFAQLHQSSLAEAYRIHEQSSRESTTAKNAALLCSSSVEFLVAWLGLMRLGFSVLLIASLAEETRELLKKVDFRRVNDQYNDADINSNTSNLGEIPNISVTVDETDVAYWHHTSGTSTGLPKPIAQSHRGAVGTLPCLDGRNQATFTTTPLYHGGIADCFRAWTSDAMIWLFPGKEAPITATNILKSLGVAAKSITPPVKYFSSVPYVLQMLASEDEGLKVLQCMDIVGVGGAPLPPSVGDDLVQKGLNLVSRFGSAECGFLMSSHRDYSMDKDWQYLRSHDSPLLSFELQDSGLSELVIRADWPHMAKKNREDGSYATADLFEPHSEVPNAWRYHSRADSQLTLITGKKFDPAPLEAAIATSGYLNDVLVFGNGKQYPGALLFRSSEASNLSGAELVEKIWPEVKRLNGEGQGHTKISRSMLFAMPTDTIGLEKSSKGTVLRRQAEERFFSVIEEAYQGGDISFDGEGEGIEETSRIPDDDIPVTILGIIESVICSKNTIPEDTDLFALGVDSVACMQIRAQLQGLLLPGSPALPLNVVYDCGSVRRLAKYIQSKRKGQIVEQEDEKQLMLDLAEKYSTFNDQWSRGPEGQQTKDEDIVILTGATGALGAHLLHNLRTSSSRPSHIICLVRAASPFAAHERVSKSLAQRLKPPLPPFSPTGAGFPPSNPATPADQTAPIIHCLPTTLSSPTLGLSPEIYTSLATQTTTLIHAAWTVNFSTRLRSFEKDHIAGLHNLLTLVLSSPHPRPPRFIFCSSTASVTSSPTTPIPESISDDPATSSPLGYSRSKWVAEQILARAATSTRLRGRIAVLRIGQLCGDTQNGVWNASEAWPLMLSSAKVTGTLPILDGEGVGWLAVDVAAAAVLEIASWKDEGKAKEDVPVYHILNADVSRTWTDLLRWMAEFIPSLTVLPAREWVEKVDREAARHPARKLVGLWRGAYCSDDDKGEIPFFSTEKAKVAAPTMRSVRPVSEEHFGKMWAWIDRNVGVEKE